MKNRQIARLLREIGAFLEMKGVPFKPRAYEKAADSLEALAQPVEEVYARGGGARCSIRVRWPSCSPA